MGLNAKVVKKAHYRKIKSKGGVRMIRVKAATAGSVGERRRKK